MIRAVEVLLFAAPLILYVLWWRIAASGRLVPTRTVLLVLLAGLVFLGAGLAWTGLRERHPESSRYVPAQLEGGRVVPGHGA